jgi:hypothetical protein
VNDYERALQAEPAVAAIGTLIDVLCALVSPDDVMCAGCVWERIVKPLTTPFVGWCRNTYDEAYYDATAESGLRNSLKSGLRSSLDMREPPTPAPTTEIERWLRTSAAYDAVTDVWLSKLDEADPGNGHGLPCMREVH